MHNAQQILQVCAVEMHLEDLEKHESSVLRAGTHTGGFTSACRIHPQLVSTSIHNILFAPIFLFSLQFSL